MKIIIYDLNSPELIELLEKSLLDLREMVIDAEEFLNNKYNIGTFSINIETCDIYLTPSGHENEKFLYVIPYRNKDKDVLIKVGRLIPESLTIGICIPIKKYL